MPLKENFCSRPFNELHIEEDGKVTPCCVMPSNRFYFGKNLKEYIESKKLKELKTSFLKGDYHLISQSTEHSNLSYLFLI